jgi:hypothetical protein
LRHNRLRSLLQAPPGDDSREARTCQVRGEQKEENPKTAKTHRHIGTSLWKKCSWLGETRAGSDDSARN